MSLHQQANASANKKRIPKRQRFMFKFWLDCAKPDERAIAEHSDMLKEKRQWQPSARDALKLLYSLRERRMDVLLMLFPWIDDYFRAKYERQESPANMEFARLLAQQTAILERLTVDSHRAQPITISNNVSLELSDKSAFVADVPPADPTEARVNFASGLGDMFGDDDTWDD
jgi:hypothetical protein